MPQGNVPPPAPKLSRASLTSTSKQKKATGAVAKTTTSKTGKATKKSR